MGKINYIFFDLDGTLVDSAPGIINGYQYALGKFGVTEPEPQSLANQVGGSLWETFMGRYGMNRTDADAGVAHYREYYRTKGMYESSVYPGMETLLQNLKRAGKKLAVVTAKAGPVAVDMLDHFFLTDYFDHIAGSAMDGSITDKAVLMRGAIEYFGAGRDETVMVGDRWQDVTAAKANGLACIGVLHGYGGREELIKFGACMIAENIDGLEKILLGK
ncbi:MAG: HAD hydrolase-like protein [Defluviitaleaceae bacterium]|nr:HAD hydrolase-like protein [Defluviitaleaceae bacterium]